MNQHENLFTEIVPQDDISEPVNVEEFNKVTHYFFNNNIEEFGVIFTFLGSFLGTLYRHKTHGLSRINYEELCEFEEDKSLKIQFINMWFGRTLIISLYGVIFLYAPTYLDQLPIIHQYIFLHALTVSMIPIFVFTFVIFGCLELNCHWVNRDWNQFEINSNGDYHQRLQNKELDISFEGVEARDTMDFTPSGFDQKGMNIKTSRMDTENESMHSNNTDLNRLYQNIHCERNISRQNS